MAFWGRFAPSGKTHRVQNQQVGDERIYPVGGYLVLAERIGEVVHGFRGLEAEEWRIIELEEPILHRHKE